MRQKKYGLTGEKGMRLFICGSYAIASDHAVFPAATNNNQVEDLFRICIKISKFHLVLNQQDLTPSCCS